MRRQYLGKRRGKGDRKPTLYGNCASVEDKILDVQDVAVVGNDTGHNGNPGLNGKIEGAFLEGQKNGVLCVAASALGKHEDALALGLDLMGSTLHGVASVLAVLAIDEDGPAQGHEQAEERYTLERSLCGDTAVLGEHGAQRKDVELGLVIADEDGRASSAQHILRILGVEVDARGEAHNQTEDPPCGPLSILLLADEGEEEGEPGAEDGGTEQTDVGGERAGGEARLGHDEGQHVERDGEQTVAREELGDVAENVVHLEREEEEEQEVKEGSVLFQRERQAICI